MTLQESGEMYLETILVLSRENEKVRSIDISRYMNYSKPSVSRAVSLLREKEYITVSADGAIALTETGFDVAERIYERHKLLGQCLVLLGVDENTAAEDACRIEHVISSESFEAIKKYMNNMER